MLSGSCRRALIKAQYRYNFSCQLSSLRAPTAKDEEVLIDLLNNRKGAIINDPEILKKYNSDWRVSDFIERDKKTRYVAIFS